MLTDIGHLSPCFRYGQPAINPSWLAQNPELATFWAARRSVSVPIDKYFNWLYQSVWDCDVTLSGSYQTAPDGLGIREITTFSSISKVGSVSTGRENKTPKYNSNGTTTLITSSTFNTDPFQYGRIPEDWLMKQRHNPCVQSNTAAVYFDASYRRTGALIGTTGLGDPPITSFNASSQTSAINITSRVKDNTRYFYASYTVTFAFSRTLTIQPSSSTPQYGTHYDPETKTIWPMLIFGGTPATVNWQGLAPKDSNQPSTHPTTTSLSVDGKSIPAGTSWNVAGVSGNLNISTRWFIKNNRDL